MRQTIGAPSGRRRDDHSTKSRDEATVNSRAVLPSDLERIWLSAEVPVPDRDVEAVVADETAGDEVSIVPASTDRERCKSAPSATTASTSRSGTGTSALSPNPLEIARAIRPVS